MGSTTQQQATAGDGSIVVMVAGDGNSVIIHDPARLHAIAHDRYLASYMSATADTAQRMLVPHYQGIPFHEGARGQDLEMLSAWLDDGARVSIRTLVGPAGTGKTRLAIEFLKRQLKARGDWAFGWLRTEELRRFTEHNALDRCSWAKDACVVIDYASAGVEALRKLAEGSLAAENGAAGAKLRLLLLDRAPDGWYESLKLGYGHQAGAVGALFARQPQDPHRVSRFDVEDRRAVLRSAIGHFCAEGKRRPEAPAAGVDAVFDARLGDAGQPWADPLFLIIAAAASVELGLGAALAMSRTELARFAAGHERSRMDRILKPARGRLISPLHHVAGLVTLAGTAPVSAVLDVAEREKARLHWGVDSGELEFGLRSSLVARPEGLGGLQPDIIGEAFVLDVLRELGGDVEARRYLEAARVLNARGAGQGLVKTLQNFALGAGAGNTAEPGSEAHKEAERRLKEQETLVALIRDYAESCERGEAEVLWAIHDAIPEGSTLLRGVRMEILGRVDSLAEASDAGQRLRLLHARGVALSLMGRREEALGAIREAVDICRRLADVQPDAFRPNLATSLNNLANRLSEVGKREEALGASREAEDIYRQLAAAQPNAFRPDLAMSLNNLANMLSEVGWREEALGASREAVDIYRQLAAAQPDAFRPNLAGSLNNLAAMLSEVGRREEALAAIGEAVDIRRQLAAAQPDAFRPNLATSLNNLAAMLSGVGKREEALAAIRESVDVSRQLAAAQPDAFLPDLGGSLNNLANRLSEVGKREEALAATGEAVDIRRQLAAAQPDAFRPDLAMSLNNLANRLSDVGRREEALAAIREAVDIRRQLAAALPDAFRPDLAGSLNNLAAMLSEVGRRDEALAAIREAVDVYRQLAAAQPDAFLPDLAMSLNNLAAMLSGVGQREEALGAIREAVDVYRHLASARPDAFRPDLATSLGLLGSILAGVEDWEGAIDSAAESVGLLLPFAAKHREKFGPLLGASFQVWHRASRAAGRSVSEDPMEAFGQLVASLVEEQGEHI